jgi:hypothetical protein
VLYARKIQLRALDEVGLGCAGAEITNIVDSKTAMEAMISSPSFTSEVHPALNETPQF